MTEQEKFYKLMREVIEGMVIGVALAMAGLIGLIAWAVLT